MKPSRVLRPKDRAINDVYKDAFKEFSLKAAKEDFTIVSRNGKFLIEAKLEGWRWGFLWAYDWQNFYDAAFKTAEEAQKYLDDNWPEWEATREQIFLLIEL